MEVARRIGSAEASAPVASGYGWRVAAAEGTGVAARCYSLSSSPVGGGPLTITVKRTADGYASNWVCDNVREGDSERAEHGERMRHDRRLRILRELELFVRPFAH